MKMKKIMFSTFFFSLLAACGGGSSTQPNTTSIKSTPAPLDTNAFIAIANDNTCANLQNRLFVIDQQYVLSEKLGTCSDARYRQTLFGKSPSNIVCSNYDSIAGPRFECSDPSASTLFKRAIENLDLPDLGLGPDHQVQAINVESKTETSLKINSLPAKLFYGTSPQSVVIKDQKLWTQFTSFGKFAGPVIGNVDFGSEMVLGTFFKTPNNCSQTQILKVSSNGQKLTAQYTENNIVSAVSCDPSSTLASTPMNLVAVPRLALPVEFVNVSANATPFEIIDQSNNSSVETAKSLVIKDQGTWQTLWRERLHVGEPAPTIDFSKKMLIAVFAGQKPNGCYGIGEVKIWRNNNKINVVMFESTPSPTMLCAMYLPTPSLIVAIDKSESEVDFTTITLIN